MGRAFALPGRNIHLFGALSGSAICVVAASAPLHIDWLVGQVDWLVRFLVGVAARDNIDRVVVHDASLDLADFEVEIAPMVDALAVFNEFFADYAVISLILHIGVSATGRVVSRAGVVTQRPRWDVNNTVGGEIKEGVAICYRRWDGRLKANEA